MLAMVLCGTDVDGLILIVKGGGDLSGYSRYPGGPIRVCLAWPCPAILFSSYCLVILEFKGNEFEFVL